MKMVMSSVMALLAATSLGGGAVAQTAPQSDHAPLFRDLMGCRNLTDNTARLACFDRAAGAFATAESEGQITVVDRAQAQETRQRLFGLNLGTANVFGNLRFDSSVDAVETTLSSARQDANGKWVFTLADASVWRQIDTERLTVRPVAGAEVRIRRAAVGSFMLSVNGARSVRARRDQ